MTTTTPTTSVSTEALPESKIYLVPFGWWKDVQDTTSIEGVLYSVSYNKDTDFEFELYLSMKDESERSELLEKEGFPGREYAFITEATWLQTVKRHIALSAAAKGFRSVLGTGDVLLDAFPLNIELSVSLETKSLIGKISEMDNLINICKRACNIFISESEPLQIWDLSGQTSKFFVDERSSMPNDPARHQRKEILLELQVYEFSYSNNGRYGRNDEMADQPKDGSSHGGIAEMNEVIEHSHLTRSNSSRSGGSYIGIGSFGLTGLQNLGNTCFMNSAIQCLVHTPELVDYFLGDYQREINRENILGKEGKLASAFGELLRKLRSRGPEPVAPSTFKQELGGFAPQFSGHDQHDSQEFLAFLLDGLHEDLNRVKCKPYNEVKDPEGRADEDVAEEYWQNHLARNNSILVDMYHGQYRSALVCPVCNKVAVTFDPFMYLSLPLPSTTIRTMSLTVLSTDGITLPSMLTITVPKCGVLKDLIDGLSNACSLGDDEVILLAEVYSNHICRFLEDPSDSLDLIRDEDRLVAYRLPKETGTSPLVVFMHQQMEKYVYGTLNPKIFGIPLVASLSDGCYGSDIRKQFLKVLNPFLMPTGDVSNEHASDAENCVKEVSEIDVPVSPTSLSDPGSDCGSGDDTCSNTDFQFYMGRFGNILIKMEEPIILVPGLDKNLEVHVLWPTEMMKKYDTCRLSSLPEVLKPKWLLRSLESVSLYKCLEVFLKEEPLGPDDMWHCPRCKERQQATKKLDLWRLPEILVIHLKRFKHSQENNYKLETYIDFPIDDLDFSSYIARKNSQLPSQYMLFAISNHYGSLAGGHYTAFIRHDTGMWYEFDDGKVSRVHDAVKTAAAYVLFYRRVSDA